MSNKSLGSATKVAFIDVTRGSLLTLAEHMLRYEAVPVMWMGYGGSRSLSRVPELYPGCEVYEYWRFNKGGTFFCEGLSFAPDSELLLSKDFLVLKDMSIKMMDRHDRSGRFRRQEREALFYSLFCFFYSKLREKAIDLIISAHSPHLPATMVFYGVCRLLGIKTVHIREVPNAPFCYLATDFSSAYLKSVPDALLLEKGVSILVDDLNEISRARKEPLYMVQQRKTYRSPVSKTPPTFDYSELRKARFFSEPADTRMTYHVDSVDFLSGSPSVAHAGKGGPKGELRRFKTAVAKLQWDEYASLVEQVDLGTEYVFFPLHYEPEKTSNPDGGEYYNTYEAVIAIRSFVPVEIPIVIKEHITQFHHDYDGYKGRSPYFYRAIKNLPNVKFVDSGALSRDLVENAMLTVCQTGTACLEAACLGKKSLLMGDVWFSSLPNVYRMGDVENFASLMARPNFSKDEVAEAAADWARKHCINGYVTGSFIRMHRARGADAHDLDIDATCREIADSLRLNNYI